MSLTCLQNTLYKSPSAPLRITRRALVLPDALGLGWCYPDAFSMKPPLADIAPNPELICTVLQSTAPAQGLVVPIFLFCIVLVIQLRCASSQSVKGPLRVEHYDL